MSGNRNVALEEALASVVHDLRNPLATICAGAEMLMCVNSTPRQMKRLAGNIHTAAVRMQTLVTDLMTDVRGNLSQPQICHLREVVIASLEAVCAGEQRRNIQIFLDVPEEMRLPLRRSKIERAFFNIIVNSFEAMPGGGEIAISARRIGDSLLIDFEDSGPGIHATIRDVLFDPFVTAGKPSGFGLGLASARQTILNHGGEVWLEPAAGARFVVRLPMNLSASTHVDGQRHLPQMRPSAR
jgi:signal transduction histidine kinase